jgi:3-oxoacyl-[acyl-carrier protein] reductase
MIDLTNKTALVTGASGDIGGACARLLHKLGAHVVISGTNQGKLEALGTELGSRYTIAVCNLKDQEACAKLVGDIAKLDILVCNAGITKDTLALRMSVEDFESVIDINLTASFILNKAAMTKMMKERYGRIINISSIVGVSGNPGQANYCASKAGLIGMSKAMACEVATRGITINTVAPGFIASQMTEVLTDGQKEMIGAKIPMKAMGSPADVANAVAFLASDAASYITGQTIHVNGGMLMV